MVSFSLRLRISYLLLQDSSLVSFHLIQFAHNNITSFLCSSTFGNNNDYYCTLSLPLLDPSANMQPADLLPCWGYTREAAIANRHVLGERPTRSNRK